MTSATTRHGLLHSGGRSTARDLLGAPVTAVAAIWGSSVLLAVFAPDLVTGSEQEHLPIAAITVWVWTFAATAYVGMAGRVQSDSVMLGAGTLVIWLGVLVVGLAAPVMETGTDPTRMPIAALLAPPIGALATALVALQHTTR